MANHEIEIRIQLKHPNKFLRWLRKSAKLIDNFNQIDFYFEPVSKPFIFLDAEGYKNANEWLRIRVGDRNEICYKKWYRDKKTKKSLYAEEIETAIDNGEKLIEILKRLEFRQIAVVKKHRESWKYKDFKFDCDKVNGLGFFVEIEFKGKINKPSKGREKIIKFLKELNIGDWKIIKGGYPWMQWNNDKKLFEKD
jgi:adenylate cyclase class 2